MATVVLAGIGSVGGLFGTSPDNAALVQEGFGFHGLTIVSIVGSTDLEVIHLAHAAEATSDDAHE